MINYHEQKSIKNNECTKFYIICYYIYYVDTLYYVFHVVPSFYIFYALYYLVHYEVKENRSYAIFLLYTR